jgi:hypothetical protein
MANSNDNQREVEILQDILILLLIEAGIPQQSVRKVVKVELARVTRIGKLLKAAKRQQGKN